MSIQSPHSKNKIKVKSDDVIYALSLHETLRLWLEKMERSGKINPNEAKELWNKWKRYPHTALTHFSVGTDILLLKIISNDLGSFLGKVYYKQYGDKWHIIFKGRPGLRTILTGTKYGIKNPKIISLGIGEVGTKTAIKQGGILSIVLLTAYNVIDYILTDKQTLMDLVGQISSDIVKIGIATGASIATATLVGVTAISTFALGPLVCAIIIGFTVSIILNHIDDRLNLTQNLKDYLNETNIQLQNNIKSVARNAESSLVDLTEETIAYLIRKTTNYLVKYLKSNIKRKINDLTWKIY